MLATSDVHADLRLLVGAHVAVLSGLVAAGWCSIEGCSRKLRPPSTGIRAPVIQRAAPDTRNATTSAMSSGTPRRPSGVLEVNQGSLYPALQRLEAAGWLRAEWGVSDNNRRARFYELTAAGRRQLAKETDEWRRLTRAVALVLGPEATGG